MKLNVGKAAFPIEFDNGDRDVIYFNPCDPDFVTRLTNAKDSIGNRLDFLNGIEISEKQQEEAESTTKALDAAKKIICEEIDGAFNGEISAVVFKHCSPFAIVNGEYFFVQFLNAITLEIQKYIGKANSELEKKMLKHIAKYKKDTSKSR